MAIMNEDYSLFFYDHPMVPGIPPVSGIGKLLEQDQDVSYLKYLYPSATKIAIPFIEEECDKLEYEGSPMFDVYPDKITFQQIAANVASQCMEKDSDILEKHPFFRDLVEVLLYHEVLYRRNRYRNRKRLYL